MMWHHGLRYPAGETWRFANHWLAHECRDLALPFELGVRVFHYSDAWLGHGEDR